MADRTEVVRSVLLQEQMFSSSTGSIDLAGTMRTANHGRYQRLFGSSWIEKTSEFRKGAVSDIDLAGTTSQEGTRTSALAVEWMMEVPPASASPGYERGLERFQALLYCRRCAVFTEDEHSSSLHDAVANSFGPRVLFDAHFDNAIASFGEVIELHYTKAWEVFSDSKEYDSVSEALNSFESAKDGLTRSGFGSPKPLTTREDRGQEQHTLLYESGNAAKAKILGRTLGAKHLPLVLLLGASLGSDFPTVRIAGVFYVPGSVTNLGMKGWYKNRTDAVKQAAGL